MLIISAIHVVLLPFFEIAPGPQYTSTFLCFKTLDANISSGIGYLLHFHLISIMELMELPWSQLDSQGFEIIETSLPWIPQKESLTSFSFFISFKWWSIFENRMKFIFSRIILTTPFMISTHWHKNIFVTWCVIYDLWKNNYLVCCIIYETHQRPLITVFSPHHKLLSTILWEFYHLDFEKSVVSIEWQFDFLRRNLKMVIHNS